MTITPLKDLPVQGKRVLMRVDFNVPLNKKGEITDDARIIASLPSIQYLLGKGAALILMSHLGRPKKNPDPSLSLTPCAKRLSELLHKEVVMAPDCIGEDVQKIAQSLQPGDIMLLENLRFHSGEEKPDSDPSFVKELAKLGDLYVNDAFGTAHRAHASTAAIASFFPKKRAMGLLLEKEVFFLGKTLMNPAKPFHAIIGGAKISTKMGAIKALLKKVDVLLIGGAMAYTFSKAKGFAIGNSLYEEEYIDHAKQIIQESEKRGVKLLLPVDNVIVEKLEADSIAKIVDTAEGIPDDWQGVDIGPKTIEQFTTEIAHAATLFWNGPLGVFEIEPFAHGTNAIAKAVANLQAMTIVGGGDSLAAIHATNVADKITHLSTGGGASIEYIEFGTLPGIEALKDT